MTKKTADFEHFRLYAGPAVRYVSPPMTRAGIKATTKKTKPSGALGSCAR
jgi:hypothetical protein